MKIALLGYGNVGKAFARLLASKRAIYPFSIVGVHTARHGTALNAKGLEIEPTFGPAVSSVAEFLDRAQPSVLLEITTLNPETGEPAISHIRGAFARNIHVITANKGPIAHAYSELREEAQKVGVEFRFESTVMDGTPVFNLFRSNFPALRVLGFTGVLNSTSEAVVAAVERSGILNFSVPQIVELAKEGKTVLIVSRAERIGDRIHLAAMAEFTLLRHARHRVRHRLDGQAGIHLAQSRRATNSLRTL